MALQSLFVAGILAALLAGCASAPELAVDATHVAAYQDDMALTGRLSVNYQQEGKSESLTGQFDWRQTAARTDISLASPLGQIIAKISVTPGAATLTQGGQAPREAADIDTLTAQALGWSLPVSGLRDWLQGHAQAADGSHFAASPRQANVTTRDGWRLTYVSWQDSAAPGAPPQPKRIDAERAATLQGGALAIRIVLDPARQP